MPMSAAPWTVPDELWVVIEPLLPQPKRSRPGGRRRLPDRKALEGILFVLHTGIAWRHLPGAARLRKRGDLLEKTRGVAGGEGVVPSARPTARSASRYGSDRMGQGRR